MTTNPNPIIADAIAALEEYQDVLAERGQCALDAPWARVSAALASLRALATAPGEAVGRTFGTKAEHVETDIAMVELLKEALIESNDARQLLTDDLVAISKLALSTTDRAAILEAMEGAREFFEINLSQSAYQDAKMTIAKLTAAIAKLKKKNND